MPVVSLKASSKPSRSATMLSMVDSTAVSSITPANGQWNDVASPMRILSSRVGSISASVVFRSSIDARVGRRTLLML